MKIRFETERLLIREFTEKDFDTTHDYGKRIEVSEYQSWGPNKEEDTRTFLDGAIDAQSSNPRLSFELAIEEKSSGIHIGGGGMRLKSTPHSEADMGYTLHPDFWGKGYGTEFTKAFVDFVFKHFKLNRIWAIVHTSNIGSYRVLEKSGFQREGVQREGLYVKGNYCDCFLYAVLRSDLTT